MITSMILLVATYGQTVNVYGGSNTFVLNPPSYSSPPEAKHRFVDLEKPTVVDSQSSPGRQAPDEMHERALREHEETLRHREFYLERHRRACQAWNRGCEDEFDRAYSVAWSRLPAYNSDLDASVIYQMQRSIAPYHVGCAPGWDRAFPPVPPTNGSYVFAPSTYGASGQPNTGGSH